MYLLYEIVWQSTVRDMDYNSILCDVSVALGC